VKEKASRSAFSKKTFDCLIIGGGPAGLTAALYLARFRRKVAILDAGKSRASWIPRTHNQAAFPGGISGKALLQRMRRQARDHGVLSFSTVAEGLRASSAGFEVLFDGKWATAKTVLLATGVKNHRPKMGKKFHREALARGLLRYCPVCDGFEAKDQAIAVLGADGHGHAEALFLRAYSGNVTLLPALRTELDAADRRELIAAGVNIVDEPATSFAVMERKIVIRVEGSPTGYEFDTLYPALGTTANASLVRGIGAGFSETGCLLTDLYQMTTVDGLYAAGDVVEGLDQIAVASGQAAIAATAIHNRLREREAAK
jgi:thioredoxin reductase (NADPH)